MTTTDTNPTRPKESAMSELTTWDAVIEANESIRVHHASGHFTREEATARLRANGVSDESIAPFLDRPVGRELFEKYGTFPCDSALLPLGDGPIDPCTLRSGHDGPCVSKAGYRFDAPGPDDEYED